MTLPISEILQSAVAHHRAGALERAEQLYRDILHSEPKHADALHLLGVAEHQTGRNNEAIDHIQQALNISGPRALFLNNLGNAYRESGRLNEATDVYHEAVKVSPEFAGAHFNFGNALEAQGETAAAAAEFEATITLDPDFADAYNNLGRIQVNSNNLAEAIENFSRAVSLQGRSVEARFNLASAMYVDRRLDEAADGYRELLRIDPGLPEGHYQLGRIFHDLGDFPSAVSAYKKVLELVPTHEQAQQSLDSVLENFAITPGRIERLNQQLKQKPADRQLLAEYVSALEQLGRFDEAAIAGKGETNDDDAQSFGKRGKLALAQGRFDDAIEHLRQSVRLQPENVEAQVDLANTLMDAEQIEEAIASYQRAVEIAPNVAAVHYNLANALRDNEQLDAAAHSYGRALKLDASFVEAHLNLGIVLRDLSQPQQALAHFETVLRLKPEDSQAHLQRAMTRLQLGQFELGWDEYEARWKCELPPASFTAPMWDGSSLHDRVLLIHAEQGIGDEIQFAASISEVSRQAAGCLIECDSRLVPLFTRSFPLADVFARPLQAGCESENVPHYDVRIPMASLPRFTRRTFDSFPPVRRYLSPDPRLVQKWRNRYDEIGAGLKVGISWRGGKRADHRRRRSTSLSQWSDVLAVPSTKFINLQYGDCKAELDECRETQGVMIFDWHDADTFDHLDELAARIAALDLVVSIDNSTAHLAGALGVPVWTLLPAAADFRWLLDRNDTPWYAAMTLIRQHELNDWESVFSTVADQLQAMPAIRRPAA